MEKEEEKIRKRKIALSPPTVDLFTLRSMGSRSFRHGAGADAARVHSWV